MPAGITIYNSSDTVQIDETYRNLRLASKQSLTTTVVSGGTKYSNYQHADFTYTSVYGKTPMVGIDSSGASFVFLLSKSGSSFTFRAVFPLAGSTVSLVAWIFDEPPSASSTTYGLQVFAADGSLVFDATMPYANYAATVVIPSETSGGTENITYNVPSGRKYLPVQAVCGVYAQSNPVSQPGQPPSFQRVTNIRLIRTDATQIVSQNMLISFSMTFAIPSIRRAANYLLLDVTYL